jgi:colanic acid/amylovoran biosynthesis glycosyltransferase
MINNLLTIIPSVPCWSDGEQISFDRKFYDGILLYINEWQGPIRLVMKLSIGKRPDFGIIKKNIIDIPFELIIRPEKKIISAEQLKDSSVVLASADSFDQLHISTICLKENIKCVYIIEYILETRYQINNFETKNLLINLRRRFFIWRSEHKRIRAFKKANGIQANGKPAFDAYKKLANTLLYFDTRVEKKSIITDIELSKRLDSLKDTRPLKLAFSGRLIAMKGVDDLILVALRLRDLNIPYHLEIYGAGDLESVLCEKIKKYNLHNVLLKGSVDFNNTLIPYIKKNIDLYLILHKQSDPSCTYLETLSCGIPIVGYNNKAFLGLLYSADIGWHSPIGDIDSIVKTINTLDKKRTLIHDKAKNAVSFSRHHDFETTFFRRIKHLENS